MTKLTNIFAIAALSSVAFAPSAFAGETGDAVIQPTTIEMKTTLTETPESRTILMQADLETEARGAVTRGDLIPVEGPDGRIYYNRIIPVSELPDPELDLRTIDTFDIRYEGDVFTNKIVQEIN